MQGEWLLLSRDYPCNVYTSAGGCLLLSRDYGLPHVISAFQSKCIPVQGEWLLLSRDYPCNVYTSAGGWLLLSRDYGLPHLMCTPVQEEDGCC